MKPTAAKRTTKKRKRGDLVYEAVNVDAELYVKMMTDDIIPAARAMYPDESDIVIQQDNAPGHAAAGVVEKIERAAAKAAEDEFRDNGKCLPKITIRNQPAQSPDMNVLDLCVFNILNVAYKRARARGQLKSVNEYEERHRVAARVARNLCEELEAAADPAHCAAAVSTASADAAAPVVDRRTRNASRVGEEREDDAARRCLDRSRGNRCTYCDGDLPLDEAEALDCTVTCVWRGGRFHTRCCAFSGMFTNIEENSDHTSLFVCNACQKDSCARRAGETKATCILCRSSDMCPECIEAECTECDHMAFCAISQGKFHDRCLETWYVTPADTADDRWCCPMCVLNNSADVMRVDAVDWSQVDETGDDTMALMKTTRAAFDDLNPQKLNRAFELCKTVFQKVIEHEGCNRYKLHTGARKRRRLSRKRAQQQADAGAQLADACSSTRVCSEDIVASYLRGPRLNTWCGWAALWTLPRPYRDTHCHAPLAVNNFGIFRTRSYSNYTDERRGEDFSDERTSKCIGTFRFSGTRERKTEFLARE